jgi:uncharacterized integral membrane protein (TIGR00698 family)
MTPPLQPPLLARGRLLLPGLLVSLVIAAAASFLSDHYGAPVMLFALLLGMAMHFLSADARCAAGIEFASKTVLRIGVALLGIRITLGDVQSLGWQPAAIVAGAVVLTILASVAAARLMGFRGDFGLLTGGATAICGVSAALALSAALPQHPMKERATLFTVIGVSALSTVAMIVYPMIAQALDLDARAAGIFLGGTIHDVAQVVGAGYSLSQEAGDTATIVKLLRVAMLLPVILVAAMVTRRLAPGDGGKRPPLLPAFAIGFVVLVAVNSAGLVPPALQAVGGDGARWCLLVAIAAIGMKTRLQELASGGLRPVLLMIGETLFLATIVLAAIHLGR